MASTMNMMKTSTMKISTTNADDEYDENFDDDEYDGDFDEDEYDDEFEEDENSYSDALDLEGATRQIELPKRNAKKEEDDFSLDFINLDE